MKKLLIVALFLLPAACRPSGPVSPHADAGAKASALRDAFNAAAGKPRLVALVSPS